MPNPLEKIFDGLKTKKKVELSESVLLIGNISVLTLDERWNTLFTDIEKTPEIIKSEEKINNFIKEQARLTSEEKDNRSEKKSLLKMIMDISSEAFDHDDELALEKIEDCRIKAEEINVRLTEIEERLSAIPAEIKKANIELLENAAMHLYYNIKSTHDRIVELDGLIMETSETLDKYSQERDALSGSYNDVYSCFHDLLGAEQISELDKLYGFDTQAGK